MSWTSNTPGEKNFDEATKDLMWDCCQHTCTRYDFNKFGQNTHLYFHQLAGIQWSGKSCHYNCPQSNRRN